MKLIASSLYEHELSKAERRAVSPVTIWSATITQNPERRVPLNNPGPNQSQPLICGPDPQCNRDPAAFFASFFHKNPLEQKKSFTTLKCPISLLSSPFAEFPSHPAGLSTGPPRPSETTKKIMLGRMEFSTVRIGSRRVLGAVHWARRLRGCTITSRN